MRPFLTLLYNQNFKTIGPLICQIFLNMNTYLDRWPELADFLKDIDNRVNKALRPPNETILDDVELQRMLFISKRTSATLREQRLIPFHKSAGKIYYLLSDVLEYLRKHRVEANVNVNDK
jgi:hypothetical protein